MSFGKLEQLIVGINVVHLLESALLVEVTDIVAQDTKLIPMLDARRLWSMQ